MIYRKPQYGLHKIGCVFIQVLHTNTESSFPIKVNTIANFGFVVKFCQNYPLYHQKLLVEVLFSSFLYVYQVPLMRLKY